MSLTMKEKHEMFLKKVEDTFEYLRDQNEAIEVLEKENAELKVEVEKLRLAIKKPLNIMNRRDFNKSIHVKFRYCKLRYKYINGRSVPIKKIKDRPIKDAFVKL